MALKYMSFNLDVSNLFNTGIDLGKAMGGVISLISGTSYGLVNSLYLKFPWIQWIILAIVILFGIWTIKEVKSENSFLFKWLKIIAIWTGVSFLLTGDIFSSLISLIIIIGGIVLISIVLHNFFGVKFGSSDKIFSIEFFKKTKESSQELVKEETKELTKLQEILRLLIVKTQEYISKLNSEDKNLEETREIIRENVNSVKSLIKEMIETLTKSRDEIIIKSLENIKDISKKLQDKNLPEITQRFNEYKDSFLDAEKKLLWILANLNERDNNFQKISNATVTVIFRSNVSREIQIQNLNMLGNHLTQNNLFLEKEQYDFITKLNELTKSYEEFVNNTNKEIEAKENQKQAN